MTTKERILSTSRVLFNIKGLGNTSVRDICKEMDISSGNFSYHYPNKDKIVEDLYSQMLNEMKVEIGKMRYGTNTFLSYLETHKVLYEIQSRYKFIYLNLFVIIGNHPKIKSLYLKTIERDKSTAKELLKMYQANGVIKSNISEDYINRALNVSQLFQNTWIIEAEIYFKGNEKKKLKYYLETCCSLVEPFLTTKSLKEYNDFFEKL